MNTGVAPPYRRWQVSYVLTDSSGTVVGRASSALDVRTLAGGGQHRDDTVVVGNLPAARGPLRLQVRVVDPTGYFPPMRLAHGVRTADGSYTLGQFTVRAR